MGLKSGPKSGKGVKQGVTKVKMGKSTSQSPSKQTDSDDEPDVDTSVMRPSIEISVSTVPQLVRAYQGATEELKSILAKECDIIYECRVCRNLFRSLANMMAHKRIYCKTNYSYTKQAFTKNHKIEDYTVLIQPEPVSSNSQENWTTSDIVPDCSDERDITTQMVATSRISSYSNTKKGLHDIVDKLARNKSFSSSKVSSPSKTTSAKLSAINNAMDENEHSYHLEDIETSKVGVFQTKVSAFGSEEEDLMKAQVSELQYMSSQNEATLGPDGKMLSSHSSLALKNTFGRIPGMNFDKNENKRFKDEHVCPDCNVKFSTRKTLNHHMKSLHVMFRICYPCPCCKSTFVNPWSVYRHLYKVHRKTAAQVRRLRPQIQKKAFKKEIHNDIPVSEGSSKTDAVGDLQKLDQENQAWMDNFEDDLELQRCGGCGRRFERRAALNSHSQICQKRIAARNNIKVPRNVPNIISSEKTKASLITEQILAIEANKKDNHLTKSKENINTALIRLETSRSQQGNSWVDNIKKDTVQEKKIEIQIRKDYCKMSSASSIVALSNDTQSETDSRAPSCIVGDEEDEDCFDTELKDWQSVTEHEEISKEESGSENSCYREAKDSGPKLAAKAQKEDGDTTYSDSIKNICEPDTEVIVLENNMLNKCDSEERTTFSDRKLEKTLKRRSSEENENQLTNVQYETNKRRRQSLEGDSSKTTDDKYIPTKNKKGEQFHPVMEARMKKLINLRRLQCLPCQKKFIKLTNLRRHVAVHIGWCRYKCMLCSFKCFSKYDCVDHVCKIHLKGVQQSKAATMVEYIEEQEAPVTSFELEVSKESSDFLNFLNSSEESPEQLSIELNSLNLEDIKNIVGVVCYPDEANKSEISSNNSSISMDSKLSTTSSPDQTDLSSTSKGEKEDANECAPKRKTCSEIFKEELFDDDDDDKTCNESALEVSNNQVSLEDIETSKETTNTSDVSVQEPPLENEDDCREKEQAQETVKPENVSRRNAEDSIEWIDNKDFIMDVCDESKEILQVTSESDPGIPLTNYPEERSEEPIREVENKIFSERKVHTQSENEVQILSYEDEGTDTKEKEGIHSKISTDCSTLEDCMDDEVITDPGSTVSCTSSEDEKSMSGNTDADMKNTLHAHEDETALRKMVMEVIFGSGVATDSHAESFQKVLAASVNGSELDDNENQDECNTAASSLESAKLANQVQRSTQVKPKIEIDLEPDDSERRERPIRNRVKVEKEDFIYNYNDSYLKKDDLSKNVHNSGNSSNMKKKGEVGREGGKCDSACSHSSGHQKGVPKLTLVRTDINEAAGSKRVNGPLKGSWSRVYTSTLDCASNKSYLESNSQMYSKKSSNT